MSDLLANFSLGLATALSPWNMVYCFVGVLLGMIVGVLPGIGSLATISLLFPLTFYLEPATALIMLAGIYYGGAYGGSITAILLNVPGAPSSSVVCLDGYPMAQQGRAGVALFLTTVASFIAGTVGILMMMLFSPFIVDAALKFGSVEYFSLIVVGMIAASTISDGSPIKGLASIVLGVSFGVIGMDMYTGTPRLTFGNIHLFEGLSLTSVAMGLFGAAEVIASLGPGTGKATVIRVNWRSMIPTPDEARRFPLPTARGTVIGLLSGILPGMGAVLASFMAYTVEKKVARDPSRFGKGAIEGVVAPEAANNAADQAAFIPTMTLGIPGSPTMALLIGVLIINGITPGPQLMVDEPEIFWGLVMSFWIGNLMLLILNVPLIGLWIRLLQVPYTIIYPTILLFVCIGAYSVGLNIADVWVVIFFGILGYAMRFLAMPIAPLILGFVLGPLMEEHFRRAMLISRGSLATFVESPFSAVALSIGAAMLLWGIWSSLRGRRTAVEL